MITFKAYRCAKCGHEKQIETNHYGECYSLGNYNRCPKCGPLPPDKKHPQWVQYPVTVWQCAEPVPEGGFVPEKWKLVRLGDIVEIVEGS